MPVTNSDPKLNFASIGPEKDRALDEGIPLLKNVAFVF